MQTLRKDHTGILNKHQQQLELCRTVPGIEIVLSLHQQSVQTASTATSKRQLTNTQTQQRPHAQRKRTQVSQQLSIQPRLQPVLPQQQGRRERQKSSGNGSIRKIARKRSSEDVDPQKTRSHLLQNMIHFFN